MNHARLVQLPAALSLDPAGGRVKVPIKFRRDDKSFLVILCFYILVLYTFFCPSSILIFQVLREVYGGAKIRIGMLSALSRILLVERYSLYYAVLN